MSTFYTDFVNFLEDYNRNKGEIFRVDFFNGISIDVPHVKLAENFKIST